MRNSKLAKVVACLFVGLFLLGTCLATAQADGTDKPPFKKDFEGRSENCIEAAEYDCDEQIERFAQQNGYTSWDVVSEARGEMFIPSHYYYVKKWVVFYGPDGL